MVILSPTALATRSAAKMRSAAVYILYNRKQSLHGYDFSGINHSVRYCRYFGHIVTARCANYKITSTVVYNNLNPVFHDFIYICCAISILTAANHVPNYGGLDGGEIEV